MTEKNEVSLCRRGIQMYIYKYMCIYIYIYIHTCICIYIYIYIYIYGIQKSTNARLKKIHFYFSESHLPTGDSENENFDKGFRKWNEMHFLNPPPFYCLNSPKRGIRKVQMPDLYLVMRMVPRRAPRPAAGSGRAGRGLAPGAGRAGAAGVEAIERRPPVSHARHVIIWCFPSTVNTGVHQQSCFQRCFPSTVMFSVMF